MTTESNKNNITCIALFWAANKRRNSYVNVLAEIFRAGQKPISKRQLSELCNCCVNTIRNAIVRLVEDGIVRVISGKGGTPNTYILNVNTGEVESPQQLMTPVTTTLEPIPVLHNSQADYNVDFARITSPNLPTPIQILAPSPAPTKIPAPTQQEIQAAHIDDSDHVFFVEPEPEIILEKKALPKIDPKPEPKPLSFQAQTPTKTKGKKEDVLLSSCIDNIPEEAREFCIKSVESFFEEKGGEYVLRAIDYANRNSKTNYPRYLDRTLADGWHVKNVAIVHSISALPGESEANFKSRKALPQVESLELWEQMGFKTEEEFKKQENRIHWIKIAKQYGADGIKNIFQPLENESPQEHVKRFLESNFCMDKKT